MENGVKNNILSCTHTHTAFCDGAGNVDEYCETAAQKGFVSLGFSAHAPLPPELGITTDWHLSTENSLAYIDAVLAAKEKWRSRLEIFLGMEIDFIDGYTGPASQFYKKFPLDYAIGSVHCVIPKGKPLKWAADIKDGLLCVDGSAEDFKLLLEKGFGGDWGLLCEAYYDSLCLMCRAGGFDVLGHADLVVKNNQSYMYDEHYRRCVEKFVNSVPDGVIAEVNTGGLCRGKTKEIYPAPPILKKLREHSIRVTVNADAHAPTHLGGFYDRAFNAIAYAGFEEYFVLRSGGWQSVLLHTKKCARQQIKKES